MTDRNTISQVIESLFEDWIDRNIDVHPLAVENMRLLEADALAMLKEQTRWIPVSEKKPKSMANKVIVYLVHDDLISQIGYGHYEKYQGEELWYNLETGEQFAKRGYTVTHWMAMPKSPQGVTLVLS